MATKDTATVQVGAKTYTNWEAFAKAGLAPIQLSCSAYKPIHLHDASCHSKLLFKAENLKRHIEGEHGGGFQLEVKYTDSKTPHPFWADLSNNGLELHDFRCDICDAQLRVHPSSILPHMKAHGGKTRRVYPGGKFNLTIAMSRPDREDLDEFDTTE